MKINITQIPPEGLVLEGAIPPGSLDLNTDIAAIASPISVSAVVHKITNTVTVDLELAVSEQFVCGRCLNEFKVDFTKSLQLNYPVNSKDREIDLSQDIREEIVLDYPIKPLCADDCKGLCPKCGNNLNKEKCNC
jgi:uncharacterized protein